MVTIRRDPAKVVCNNSIRRLLFGLGGLLLLAGCSSSSSSTGSDPVIASFIATPSTIASGASSTLSWSVTGATTLRLDPGAIDVSSLTQRVVGPLTASTTYTLTATNATGSVTANATVTVGSGSTDAASGAVSSNSTGTFTTPLGAKITVPLYAVPLTSTSGTGTMTFSIEKTTASSLTPPSGETLLSDVYRFGPEGFVFAAPVMVTIPVPNASTSSKVNMYRVDPTTGVATRVPSTYDPTGHTVSAMTSAMSLWGATSAPTASTADGAVRLINTSSNMWLKGCVDTYTLSYPSADPNPNLGGQAASAPAGTVGWNSTIIWGLPQGTYRICCEMSTAGTLLSPPGAPVFWYVNGITVGTASTYPNYQTSADITYGTPPTGATAGSCPCTPVPTPSPGTGQVQVTLSWFSASAVDLDLYVTDPSGATVYYSNPSVASGGTLDRDNNCGNYVNGKPENVFWNTAPTGQYIVTVKWFSGCSSGLSSMPFTVRIVNKTNATTFSGTITSGSPSIEVTRFTVQ